MKERKREKTCKAKNLKKNSNKLVKCKKNIYKNIINFIYKI